jgi:DNA repair photolyase
MIVDTGYLYSKDNSRVFVNTALGCKGSCSYCYLPKIGYSNTYINLNKPANLLIEEIKDIKGITNNTLISLGCYSECFDDSNVEETKTLLKYFLSNNYQVQLSTKKHIKIKDIKEISKYIKYKGQLIIFVSFSTISYWKTHEKNTDNPNKRIKNFNIKNKYNIPVVLYIKPVLENVTIKDIDIFKNVINKYLVEDVVVGSIFKETGVGEKVVFLKKLYYSQNEDEEKIIKELKPICNVYKKSTEVLKKYPRR